MKTLITGLALLAAGACATLHLGALPRDPSLVGEWIDVRHAAPEDTSLWVLRADGYDGTAHVHRLPGGVVERQDSKYGRWYLRGSIADSAHRAICFARRLGRDGATCVGFSLDTIAGPAGPLRQLVVRGYEGQHTTGDRILIERAGPPR